jgi:predicted  nucleic acid-binding Zn-ribbon protein
MENEIKRCPNGGAILRSQEEQEKIDRMLAELEHLRDRLREKLQ